MAFFKSKFLDKIRDYSLSRSLCALDVALWTQNAYFLM